MAPSDIDGRWAEELKAAAQQAAETSTLMDTPRRWGSVSKAIHWAGAVLMIAAWSIGIQLEDWPRGPNRDTAMMIHYSIGTIIAVLLAARLIWRGLNERPAEPAGTSPLARLAARGGHVALYAAMFALPLTGAFDRWARGRPLWLFGDNLIASPFALPNTRFWRETHTWLGYAIAVLVVLHVAAALWHHFGKRDDVLRRMMPGRRR